MVCRDGLNGRMPDREDCSKYYECSPSGAVHKQCPEGQLFSNLWQPGECESPYPKEYCGGRSFKHYFSQLKISNPIYIALK